MKAVMLMFDSLNRRFLPPYGCDSTIAPNFARLAQRTVTFDNFYVCSMPCMPARRELHTGRPNFLHRSWGPLEPYDDSMPALLKQGGIHTHLVSDHYHYWEDGGANYHCRYSTWDCIRGQEGDPWIGQVRKPEIPEHYGQAWPQDQVNRQYIRREQDMPQAVTMGKGIEFLRRNAGEDNWFLQIETFDPHEPFFSQAEWKKLYAHDYKGPRFDWPKYQKVTEPPEAVAHCRYEYLALLSMCDHYLGKVLDAMDELDLWKDTMLIVNTDHGFLLGEHDWWAKCAMPFYDEVAHTPLFIWDPRCGKKDEQRESLVQTIDLAPTLLEYFGRPIPPDMLGVPLGETIATDKPVREAGLFGLFGGHVNVTDGRYVYMRAPADANNTPLHEYTLMPAHMRGPFGVEELQDIAIAPAFSFTKGCRLMIVAARPWRVLDFDTMLFDLKTDPKQERPIHDDVIETRMIGHLRQLMQTNDAPADQYERLGLPHPKDSMAANGAAMAPDADPSPSPCLRTCVVGKDSRTGDNQ
jgi:arylsulfatase A-like enzyme